ncbi:Spy/CpxP family protein refolding chaperone [Legionella maioricensis]|uniref:Spy/CpxP family protein refolding chaperone n=1 Tax=Legionella maioricensis TaxID=2896528 RepID=A0A9X2CZN2_9GAMM|nr:Spy/CpxP family protein refolding chaperone [Legionella maioricensis]MCL9683711.1 Spy/CpxP family protein refolding chaperone [Legionella maioricensis]MCL9687485.1 Spy/CpxP family protein refolding chaperone [Legionella maioricensis]
MNKKSVWLSAVALSLMIGQASFATTEPSKSRPCTCHHNSPRLSEKLNLTAEQKTKIKAIRAQTYKQLKADEEQLKALKLQMNALANNDKVDEAKLNSLIDQRNKIKGDMLKKEVMMQNQIYNTLTAQQKAQYKELKTKPTAKTNS